ncbi:MAG: pilus assembly protein TadG-related protein [Hyphomicrobiaceae bacterium]
MMDRTRLGAARYLDRFRHDEAGGILVAFAVSLPILVAAVSLAVDYSQSVRARDQMQAAADAAALAAARELGLANARQTNMSSIVAAVVDSFVSGIAPGKVWGTDLRTTTKVDEGTLKVHVTLESSVPIVLGMLAGQTSWGVEVASEAQVIGSPNICILGLDPAASGTISLERNADVLGERCAVFSNSDHPNGIRSKNSSKLMASLICTAGGKEGGKGNFLPEPLTGCPQFDDPLAERPEPAVDVACRETSLVVSAEKVTLAPGTYCGGLRIEDGATVALERGIYTIKDGPLVVSGGAELKGDGVGFYFTGSGAVLDLAGDTTVSLAAAVDGPMAGLLMFESRSQSKSGKHVLLSDNAQTMVGTIYLPRGELQIGGSSEMGTESAYTAIVARQLTLTEGPRVVLHTNYDDTDVPVPDGIRGTNMPVALVK